MPGISSSVPQGTNVTDAPATSTTAEPATDPVPTDFGRVPVTQAHSACPATSGNLEHLTFESEVMRIVHPVEGYFVYTPPCYVRDTGRRYPTIWLLHGAQRDETQWVNIGLIEAADQMIASGEIPPVIIVLADGIHAQGEYTAPPGSGLPFDDYLLRELMPRVQQGFRTLDHRSYRAIGGISRGGEWALLEASRHPDIFGSVGGHSAAIGSPTNTGPELAPRLAGRELRIWVDVGSGDSLLANVASLDSSLNDLDTAHEYRVFPGGHNESYWRAHLASYLRWYTEPWRPTDGH